MRHYPFAKPHPIDLQSPGCRCSGIYNPPEHRGSEAIQQGQGSVNNQDIDPASVQIRPMRTGDLDAIAVIDCVCFGARPPEYYREKLSSATRGAGINTSLVSEARTSISQVDCKE
jgi:hypothetical protein